jgi:hypothetical protein
MVVTSILPGSVRTLSFQLLLPSEELMSAVGVVVTAAE